MDGKGRCHQYVWIGTCSSTQGQRRAINSVLWYGTYLSGRL